MDEDLTKVVRSIILRAVLLEHLLNVLDVVLHVIIATNKLSLFLFADIVCGDSGELISMIVTVLAGTAADSDARNGAEHDGKADEGDVDKDVGDILLAGEVKDVDLWSETNDSHNVTNDD